MLNDSSKLHTENFFRNLIKSTWNQIVFTIFRLIRNQTEVRLVPNQSENGKYNLISGWFNKISKKFLCVHVLLKLLSSKVIAIKATIRFLWLQDGQAYIIERQELTQSKFDTWFGINPGNKWIILYLIYYDKCTLDKWVFRLQVTKNIML